MGGESSDQIVEAGTLVLTALADGKPVAGQEAGVFSVTTGHTIATVSTDARGQAIFRLPGGERYQFSVTVKTGASGRPGAGLVSAPGNAYLPPNGTVEHTFTFYLLHGHALNQATGKPIAAAEARLKSPQRLANDPAFRGPIPGDVRANVEPSTGAFSFIVAPGTYDLHCWAPDHFSTQKEITVGEQRAEVTIYTWRGSGAATSS